MRLRAFKSNLSDFDKIATTIPRKSLPKDNSKTILDRDNKLFDQKNFNPFVPNAPFL